MKVYINKNGFEVKDIDYNSNEDIVIDLPPVDVEKNKQLILKNKILSVFQNKMQKLSSNFPKQERETWAMQVTEAKAIVTDATAEAPLLKEILKGEDADRTLLDLAQRVLFLSALYSAEAGKLLAEKNMALRELEI